MDKKNLFGESFPKEVEIEMLKRAIQKGYMDPMLEKMFGRLAGAMDPTIDDIVKNMSANIKE